jgi:hypothetical protein
MGWLGWPWEQVRWQDVNVLQLALDGREELLATIFGGGKAGGDSAGRPMSPASFRAFANRHNQRYARSVRRARRAGGEESGGPE